MSTTSFLGIPYSKTLIIKAPIVHVRRCDHKEFSLLNLRIQEAPRPKPQTVLDGRFRV